MKLLILFGPPAVGKMTVAQALARQMDFSVFHNHMTIDLLMALFGHGTVPFRRLNGEFRRRIIEEAALAGVDMIFTYVWALGDDWDKAFIDSLAAIVEAQKGEVFFAELAAPLEERLVRNRSEHRLKHKPISKSDVEATERRLLENEARYRFNSDGDFFYPERHIKLDDHTLNPDESAALIRGAFGW